MLYGELEFMCDTSIHQILAYLPDSICRALEELPAERQKQLEELRFRMGCEVTALFRGEREQPLSLVRQIICTPSLLQHLLNAVTGYSAYASDESLRQGFLPLPGGHRLGICGTAVLEQGEIRTFHPISSANLRLARQWPGCADGAMKLLGKQPENTLVLGPPSSGKTTLLRDLCRQLSDVSGQRVGVVDSRGELAACLDGMPQLNVGRQTDVIAMAPKEQGLEILVRTMNPQWVVMDEITAAGDVEAMLRASYCGIRLLASAHAFDQTDFASRPLYQRILSLGLFQNFLILSRDKQVRLERVK